MDVVDYEKCLVHITYDMTETISKNKEVMKIMKEKNLSMGELGLYFSLSQIDNVYTGEEYLYDDLDWEINHYLTNRGG